jgi:hypothetical protein
LGGEGIAGGWGLGGRVGGCVKLKS